ncbi:MAG: hypothetical protein ACLQGP_11840 [Isosphaeraceae bacterium]
MPQDSRIAEVEQRIGSLEKSLDLLRQEVGNLKRMIRFRWKEPDQAEPRPFVPAQ